MKKIIMILTLLIVSFYSLGQCTPAPAVTAGLEFDLVNETDFGFGVTYNFSDPYDVDPKFWYLECSSNNNEALMELTFEYFYSKDIRLSFELWVEEYDCAGNSLGSEIPLESTPLEIFPGNPIFGGFSTTINHTFTVPIDPTKNLRYRGKVKYKKKILTGWGAWDHWWSRSVRFIPATSFPNPNGNFNDLLNVEPRTSAGMGWTVDVHQLDASGAFDFDATSTSCENSYRYEIAEFDLDTWSQSSVVATGWIPGEAGIIDMDAFYTYGFDIGKLYKLKLIAGSGWYSKDYWFEVKSPQIVGTISHLNAYATPVYDIFGNTTYFTYYEVCNNTPVYLYTDGTESYDQYRITIEELDTYYNPTGSSETTLWQAGIVPSTYNVNALWGGTFNTSRRYKVVYEIRNPLLRKEFYIKPVSCPGIGRGDSGNSGNNRGKSLEETNSVSDLKSSVSIYPNPTKGVFKVDLQNNDSEDVMIEVINLEGKTIYRTSSTGTQFEFDLTEYPNGIYLIKINTNNELLLEKVIKR